MDKTFKKYVTDYRKNCAMSLKTTLLAIYELSTTDKQPLHDITHVDKNDKSSEAELTRARNTANKRLNKKIKAFNEAIDIAIKIRSIYDFEVVTSDDCETNIKRAEVARMLDLLKQRAVYMFENTTNFATKKQLEKDSAYYYFVQADWYTAIYESVCNKVVEVSKVDGETVETLNDTIFVKPVEAPKFATVNNEKIFIGATGQMYDVFDDELSAEVNAAALTKWDDIFKESVKTAVDVADRKYKAVEFDNQLKDTKDK